MRNFTSKRFFSLLCALALCVGMVPAALAAGTAKPEKKPSTVGWAELDGRIREGFAALSVSEQLDQLEALDFDELREELLDDRQKLIDQINKIAGAPFASAVDVNGIVNGAVPDAATPAEAGIIAGTMAGTLTSNLAAMQAQASSALSMLDTQYDALQDTIDDLDDGEPQKDNDDRIRQLRDGVEQIVAGGQTLYLTIVGLENTRADALRGLDTLDRNLTELRARQKLGQVSAQTVASLEQTRRQTANQLAVLETSISACKAQLQLLMGEEADGALTLGALPAVDWKTLEAMDPDKDLPLAKERSVALYQAKLALDDAGEAWDDYDEGLYQNYHYDMARHAWSAAQFTYTSQVKSFETAFRALYETVQADWGTLQAKLEATEHARTLFAAERTKHERGLISENKLKEARDSLEAAFSEERSARLQLFQDYHAYENAVQHGILDQGGAQ